MDGFDVPFDGYLVVKGKLIERSIFISYPKCRDGDVMIPIVHWFTWLVGPASFKHSTIGRA